MSEAAEKRSGTVRLKDRVALVTGGDRGLGLGIARAFAREGARVCIANPHADSGEAAARQIEHDGGSAMAVAMDVTYEGQVEAGSPGWWNGGAAWTFWYATRACSTSTALVIWPSQTGDAFSPSTWTGRS